MALWLVQASREKHLRQIFAWCIPALIAGFMLRAALTVELPYGYYHADTPDFLTTADRLLFQHRFELHAKKTFLVPIFFAIPFLLKVPALIVIPMIQHLLGLVIVLLVGLLCRLWFAHWKWFVVPVTLLVALNPALLWYEHTLMAETLFVFCTLLVAVAGTFYAQCQSQARFVFLCGSLFLVAGARPEGKLLFGFGLLLVVLLEARDRKKFLPRFAAIVLLAVATHFLTKTSQAGLLLYTSVARLTPPDVKAAPGLEPYITAERAALQQRWDQLRLFPKVTDRRIIADAVEQYLAAQKTAALPSRHQSVNAFCQKLAGETCVRQLHRLPEHVYWKFRYTANDAPNGLFDEKWLWEIQSGAYADQIDRSLRLSNGLIGKPISSPAQWNDFVKSRYQPVPWFNLLSERWYLAVNTWRLPDVTFRSSELTPGAIIYRCIPIYFLLGAIGMALITLRSSSLRWFHIAWGLSFAAFFFAIILTANVKPRFRLVFEPFWFLYIGLLIDFFCSVPGNLLRSFLKPKTATANSRAETNFGRGRQTNPNNADVMKS